ncbi:MAG: hypothetical protein AB7I25_05500 [Vicinamibacterales bacterium]
MVRYRLLAERFRVPIGVVVWLLGATGAALLLETGRPAPWVNVRWNATVSEAARHRAEVGLQLGGAKFQEGTTWAYALLDDSPPGVERLVRHPLVDDTHRIDRAAFRVADDAPRGPYRTRLLNRVPALRTVRTSLPFLTIGLWLLGWVALRPQLRRFRRAVQIRWDAWQRSPLRARLADRFARNAVVRAYRPIAHAVGGVTIGGAIAAGFALAMLRPERQFDPDTPPDVLRRHVLGTWGQRNTPACEGGAPDALLTIDSNSMTWSDYGVSVKSHDVVMRPLDVGNAHPGMEISGRLPDGSKRRLLVVVDSENQLAPTTLEVHAANGDITLLPRPDILLRCGAVAQ